MERRSSEAHRLRNRSDLILYVDRTLSVCELSDIGHIRMYIVCVGEE